MYTCRWFVLCEAVILDRYSNNLSVINALTELRVASLPAIHPRFAFAALLEREGDEQGPLSLRFVREKEKEDEILVPIGEQNNKQPRIQFFINFPIGIRLTNEGTITFRIELKEGDGEWYSVGSQKVQVSLSPPKAQIVVTGNDNAEQE